LEVSWNAHPPGAARLLPSQICARRFAPARKWEGL
jgi:hypothetical protein